MERIERKAMHIENLKKGSYIVITGRKNTLPAFPPALSDTLQMMPMSISINEYEPSGVPMKVLATSPPFVAVEPICHPNMVSTVNLKIYDISVCHRSYVTAFKKKLEIPQ